MTRWIRSTKDPAWAALFTGYTKSAYRLEGQQIYSNPMEDATLARFLAGEPLDIDLSWVLPKVRAQLAAGRTETQVRIVLEPPTDYTRLELLVYPELAAAGMDVRIIAAPEDARPAELPEYDYWLFDERDVWRMHYGEDHRFRGAELLEGEDVIARHLQWRDVALSRAVPLDEYLVGRQTE